MNKIIKYSALSLLTGFIFAGCADWITPERVIVQHPDEQSPIVRDDAYYQALRAYKQTHHKVAFGWYGSWTANGASLYNKRNTVAACHAQHFTDIFRNGNLSFRHDLCIVNKSIC